MFCPNKNNPSVPTLKPSVAEAPTEECVHTYGVGNNFPNDTQHSALSPALKHSSQYLQ